MRNVCLFLILSLAITIHPQDWVDPYGNIDVELKIMDSQLHSEDPRDKKMLLDSINEGIQNSSITADSIGVRNILISLAHEPLNSSNAQNLLQVREEACIALAALYSPESEEALYKIVAQDPDDHMVLLTVSLLSKQTIIYNQLNQLIVAKRLHRKLYTGNRRDMAYIYMDYVEYLAHLDGVYIENEIFETLMMIIELYPSSRIQTRAMELARALSGI